MYIIWERPGGVSVQSLGADYLERFPNDTDYSQAIARERGRLEVKYGTVTPHVMAPGDLPYHLAADHACDDPTCHDNYFRDAICYDGNRADPCHVDMSLAREIHSCRTGLAITALEQYGTPEELKAARS